MEEYIRLEEENFRWHGKVYNWETAKYGKIWYDEDVHDLRSVETEFPAIVFNDELSFEKTLSCELTVGKALSRSNRILRVERGFFLCFYVYRKADIVCNGVTCVICDAVFQASEEKFLSTVSVGRSHCLFLLQIEPKSRVFLPNALQMQNT
ncbi:hypothetical protein Tco_0602373 [Tanacetum coccineum]